MAKKILDQIRDAIRLQQYSYRTEGSYIDWARCFILFHNKRHPDDMGAAEINAILTHLATQRSVAASPRCMPLECTRGCPIIVPPFQYDVSVLLDLVEILEYIIFFELFYESTEKTRTLTNQA